MQKLSNSCLLILLCLLAQSCGSNNSSRSFRTIGAALNQSYRLTNSDLIITYDLAKIDRTNCIYSADLGLIINDKNYTRQYINKFKINYKSPLVLRREAEKKIVRIYKLLLALHKKHRVLSNKNYQYVKRVSKMDLTNLDSRNVLSSLDKIIAFIPIMLPSYKANITSKYGDRHHPIHKKKKFHCGLDLVAKPSAPIYATANAKVIFAGKQNGYGNAVELRHSNNLTSFYAHLSKTKV
ncbi:MAG: M23 family metallopeptidase, partial [Rickettsiaceae bacterium]|nr:M23 family metallopeptidase [Rickettsiaceae bacterium]